MQDCLSDKNKSERGHLIVLVMGVTGFYLPLVTS